ncbi:MAG: 5-dehydro-2-deoxygluconokinase [Erysipelotrichaceae bacterium]|nr:5-dehydro-2-deoxygluconokinase [Erysipelotrichaceae bacterium]
MSIVEFEKNRSLDAIMLGRIAIDFYPEQKHCPLNKAQTFSWYVGGSPANIAAGWARLGGKIGFLGKVSDDQFGTFVVDFLKNEGVDTSHIAKGKENLGLAFTEVLSDQSSSLLMYRNNTADLHLSVEDISEEYIAQSKLLLISGTALSMSPSREAAFKAVHLAHRYNVRIVFDIDYRPQNWNNLDEVSVYYAEMSSHADIILGSREEFDLMERLVNPNSDDKASAAYWHAKGAKIVVIKHGKDGSTAYANDGQCYTIKPFPVQLQKGFGGGDAYASAFLYSLMGGLELSICLERGSAAAAMVVASPSCSAHMPKLSELIEFIEEEKRQYGEMIHNN